MSLGRDVAGKVTVITGARGRVARAARPTGQRALHPDASGIRGDPAGAVRGALGGHATGCAANRAAAGDGALVLPDVELRQGARSKALGPGGRSPIGMMRGTHELDGCRDPMPEARDRLRCQALRP